MPLLMASRLTAANLPGAAVTFDKLHVVGLVSAAVEKVRRLEQKTPPELAGSRCVWLRNPENLTTSPVPATQKSALPI
jgi:transposase